MVMELPSKLGNPSSFDRLVICVDRLTKENVSMFYGMAVRLANKFQTAYGHRPKGELLLFCTEPGQVTVAS